MNGLVLVFFRPGSAWIPGKTVFEQPLDEHVAYLRDLHAAGKVLMAGPFVDGSGGMTILRTDSEREAAELAAKDPSVIQRILEPTICKWKPLDLAAT